MSFVVTAVLLQFSLNDEDEDYCKDSSGRLVILILPRQVLWAFFIVMVISYTVDHYRDVRCPTQFIWNYYDTCQRTV